MKPLDSIEIKLCRLQAKIFEKSVKKTTYSSPIFIRRFMLSNIAKLFDEKKYLFSSVTTDETFELLDEEFGESTYGITKYSEDQMFWIGYIYRCISIKYNLSSKTVYELFNAKEIIKHYKIGHTFDIVQAAERMMENINYNTDIEEKSFNLMRRLMITDTAKSMLGKDVTVYIDKPIGFKDEDGVYTQNYGYIKDFKAFNGEYQNAYVLGNDKPEKVFSGKVIAVINRKDDTEDNLVVCDNDTFFTNDQIEELVSFKEQKYQHKIIRK